jgi:hypothetical protein
MRTLRSKLTYANVTATLALFLAMSGGVVWAAHRIGANQLKSNSVGTSKIKRNAVTAKKIKKNAVTTAKIAENAVTSPKIDEGAVDFTKIAAGTNVIATANGGPVSVSGSSPPLVSIPLTGTTSFTPIPGNVDLASIEARGNLTSSTSCSVEVFLYVNGRAFGGGVLSLKGGSSSENQIPAAGATVPVGLGQAGLLQQISVKMTPGPECEASSQVSVSMAVTRLK